MGGGSSRHHVEKTPLVPGSGACGHKRSTLRVREPCLLHFCRCGLSNKFPYCDMSHAEHNRTHGTSYVPYMVSVTEDTTFTLCHCGETTQHPFCADSQAKLDSGGLCKRSYQLDIEEAERVMCGLKQKPGQVAMYETSRDADKEPYRITMGSGDSYMFCSCSKSEKMPICDSSHIMFNYENGTDLRPFTISTLESKTVFMCGCGLSKNRPFCDGSHEMIVPSTHASRADVHEESRRPSAANLQHRASGSGSGNDSSFQPESSFTESAHAAGHDKSAGAGARLPLVMETDKDGMDGFERSYGSSTDSTPAQSPALLRKSQENPMSPPPAPRVFRRMVTETTEWTLTDIVKVTPSVKSYRFSIADDKKINTSIGSDYFVSFTDDRGNKIERPFSPVQPRSNEIGAGQYTELIIKRYPVGSFATWVKGARVGDVWQVRGPLISFEHDPTAYSNFFCLSGGVGILPFLQLVRQVLSSSTDRTRITLLCAFKTPGEIICRDEFDELAGRFPERFRFVPLCTQAPASWEGERRRLSDEVMRKYLPPPSDDTMAGVCGPPRFMSAALKLLRNANYATHRIVEFS